MWFEFPFDERVGSARNPLPAARASRFSSATTNRRFPLARFGTTIGGWRGEYIDGSVMLKYKGSPVGKRVWSRIAAAPIWVPPREHAAQGDAGQAQETREEYYEVNYHTTGPSYASAYGLVAAYHRKYYPGPDGEIRRSVATKGSARMARSTT